MARVELSDFLKSLRDDKALRERFAKDPAGTLKRAGYDTNLLSLPSRIDLAALEAKIEQLTKGDVAPFAAQARGAARLSPDELWNRLGLIGVKSEQDEPSLVAVVVYGSSIVVGVVAGAASASLSPDAL